MSKIDEILALAASQIGTKNTSQYNLAYYGSKKDPGYAWCVVFLWWLFRQTGMAGLFYGGGKTASSNTLYNYHKGRGQAVTDYRPGDIIFFDTTGKRSSINHVGICESYNGTTMVSIDGNTSGPGSTSESNGGQVNRRSRKASSYVMAAIRPDYESMKEEEEMDAARFTQLLNEVDPMINTEAELKAKVPGLFAEVMEIVKAGYIKGNGTDPIAKRVSVLEAMVVMHRMLKGG